MQTDILINQYDETAPLSRFKHNGYYQVGDKIFNFRFNALEYATKTNQPVTWEFNTSEFRVINWRTPLHVDIRTLYKRRAQQLRDKYDYLILSFSGGADSTTVLQSFIYNNIHLDEIICDWPIEHTSALKVTNDPTPFNHYSEWELAIKPMLDYVSTHYPKIKITITDTTKDLTIEDNEHTFTISHMGPYQSTKRYKNVAERFAEVNKKIDRVAIIMGTEKPTTLIERNIFCVYFADQHCFFKSSHMLTNRVVEYFYWAADTPELVREQAHLIYQHLLANPKDREFFGTTPRVIEGGTRSGNIEQRLRDRYRNNLIKSIVYPDWNTKIFQADKSDSLIYSSQHAWIMQEDTRVLQAWENSLINRTSAIDPKYLNFYPNSQLVHGIKSFYSRLYPIGVLPTTE